MSSVRPEPDEHERDLFRIPDVSSPKSEDWKLSEFERADGKRCVEELRRALRKAS